MNIIELDFMSIVIGYTVGIAMMWSLTQTVFFRFEKIIWMNWQKSPVVALLLQINCRIIFCI